MKNQGPKIDFRAYKTGHMLRLVIAEFGLLDSHGRPLTHRGPCPCCCTHKPTARYLAVEFSKGKWYCHKCKRGGDPLDLWGLLRKMPVWQAALELSAKDRTPVPYLVDSTPPPQAGRFGSPSKTPGLALGNGSMPDADEEVKQSTPAYHQGTLYTEVGGA